MKFRTLATVLVVAPLCVVRAQEKSATVTGYVLDSACAFIKNLKKPVSADCALASAKTGSPLVILGDDGTIYWPISSVYIRKEYMSYEVRTQDGRALSGLLAEQDAAGITLVDADYRKTRIPRSEVSIMPEGLLEKLKPQQLRDLFAYLQSKEAGGKITPLR